MFLTVKCPYCGCNYTFRNDRITGGSTARFKYTHFMITNEPLHIECKRAAKKKIKNGAEYIVTQMFFDNQKYFDFVAKCRKEGITAPIIPGLKPITTKKQLNLIPHRFHVDLPDDLIMSIVKCKDNKAVREVGIEWCIAQSKELVNRGVPILHYYSMGKSASIYEVAANIF